MRIKAAVAVVFLGWMLLMTSAGASPVICEARAGFRECWYPERSCGEVVSGVGVFSAIRDWWEGRCRWW